MQTQTERANRTLFKVLRSGFRIRSLARVRFGKHLQGGDERLKRWSIKIGARKQRRSDMSSSLPIIRSPEYPSLPVLGRASSGPSASAQRHIQGLVFRLCARESGV